MSGKGKPRAASPSSSSASSSSEDERPVKKAAAKKAAAPKKKAASSSESSSSASSSESEDEKPKKKAPAKKAAPAKKKAASSSSESSSESDSDSDDGKKKKKAAPVKKVTKPAAAAPKKPANAFAGLDGSEEDADSESEESEDEKPKKKATTQSESEDEKPAATTAKGKKAAAQKKDDDLDDLFNDLNVGHPTDESKMTKAQLKRLRQKQKQEAEKNAPADAAPAAAAPAPKKEEKKKAADDKKKAAAPANKAVEALREKLRQQKEEEDRRRKEEEERLAAEEAERIRIEAEEKAAAEEKLRKQEARAKAREVARAEGKLLSKTEKAAQAKRQAFLQQLAASGAQLPAALQKEKDEAEASAADGASPVAPKEKQSKKDQIKKKSAFGKRLEAQKEADRIRAERHAQEDEARAAQKQEDARRKQEDLDLEAALKSKLDALDAEEAKLDAHVQVDEAEEKSDEEEEEVADSWEDVDSEEDRRKETEKEERRAAKIAQRIADEKAKEARRVQLKKDREDVLKAREAEIAEVKKQRQTIDDARRKKADDEKKAQEESERAAIAVASGFELAADQTPAAEESAASTSSGKDKGRNRDLRSPIVCILGHVDTGKTKILDNIRQTSVGSHEAGGITQQIGATFMPRSNILAKTAELNKFLGKDLKMDMPGLLAVDTPGHESFTNLRSRGSNLCDIAVLVVDIMHGLEQQTIESINLLKQRKTPFVVALNKIDRCYGWKSTPNAPFQMTLKNQPDSTQSEFEKRARDSLLLLSEQGLNCELYYRNSDMRRTISVVPTSALTGEGIPDLLMLLVQLTQNMLNERLSYGSELSCTVLEVKVIEGLGTTIDVILVNGQLHEGDTIVVCGLTGPIVTTIRALLTPPPMQEIRVKADYVHHKTVKAAMGVKISAQGLENAVAGSSLLVCGKKDDIEDLKDEVQGDLATILSKVDKSGQGVAVQASTLGSLEALLAFLGDMKIPVSSISIGPVYKKDIIKASVMLEKRPEFAVLLAFDVKVSPEAQKMADELGVKVFTADIIYHLFDRCTAWMEGVKERKRVESADTAVFPVVLDILPNAIFNVKSPIVLGVRVAEGVARIGTPICIPSKQFLYVGRITGIQKNHTDFQEAKKGEEFALKLEQSKSDQQIVFGRHFDASSQLVSKMTRESIDLLKANFKDDLTDADWRLVVKLKKVFDIL